MKSKAQEWSARFKEHESAIKTHEAAIDRLRIDAEPPTFRAQPDMRRIAFANEAGYRARPLTARDAVAFARWILATFEPPEAPPTAFEAEAKPAGRDSGDRVLAAISKFTCTVAHATGHDVKTIELKTNAYDAAYIAAFGFLGGGGEFEHNTPACCVRIRRAGR